MALGEETALSGGQKLVERAVALDRSSEPFFKQLDEAYEILNLQTLPPHPLTLEHITQDAESFGWNPRIEWTFRWLLKKFNTDELEANSPCLHAEAWYLARRLLLSTPNRVAASLIKAIKLLSVLSKTLAWASQHGCNSQSVTTRPGKKRKRDSSNLPSTGEQVDPNLIPSICLFVHTLRSKTESARFGTPEAFAAENLKSSVRADLEAISDLVFNGLTSALELIGIGQNLHLVYKSVVIPLCWLWKCAPDVVADAGDAADLSFSSKCVVPALKILTKFPVNTDMELKLELDTIIATHCVVPARETFMSHKSPRDRMRPAMRELLSDYLSPIYKVVIPTEESSGGAGYDHPTLYHPLTYLYSLAARAFPRNSIPQRTKEDLWLTALFDSLSYRWLNETMSSGRREVLRQLLHVADHFEISLDKDMVEKSAKGGLTKIEDQWNIDWRTFGLCVAIRPNFATDGNDTVFTIFSVVAQASYDIMAGPISQNFHLSRAEFGSAKIKFYEDCYRSFLSKTVDVFIRQRKLPAFLFKWRHGLESYIKKSVQLHDSERLELSVWEDERIVHAVADSIEGTMTDDQMHKQFKKLFQFLNANTDYQSNSNENFVAIHVGCTIATAILGRITRTSCIDLLESDAKRVYRGLYPIIVTQTASETRKHVWSLLSIIARLWPDVVSQIENEPTVPILKWALEEVRYGLHEADLLPSAYQEAFQAFHYINSVACIWSADQTDTRHSGAVWVEAVNLLSESLSHLSNVESREAPSVSWSSYHDELTDKQILLLACCSLLSTVPSAFEQSFREAPDPQITVYYTQSLLHVCQLGLQVIGEKHFMDELGTSKIEESNIPISFIAVWFQLLCNPFLETARTTSRAVRNVLLREFTALGSNNLSNGNEISDSRPRVLDVNSTHAFLCTSVATVGLQFFSRQQRVDMGGELLDHTSHLSSGQEGSQLNSLELLSLQLATASKIPSLGSDLSKFVENMESRVDSALKHLDKITLKNPKLHKRIRGLLQNIVYRIERSMFVQDADFTRKLIQILHKECMDLVSYWNKSNASSFDTDLAKKMIWIASTLEAIYASDIGTDDSVSQIERSVVTLNGCCMEMLQRRLEKSGFVLDAEVIAKEFIVVDSIVRIEQQMRRGLRGHGDDDIQPRKEAEPHLYDMERSLEKIDGHLDTCLARQFDNKSDDSTHSARVIYEIKSKLRLLRLTRMGLYSTEALVETSRSAKGCSISDLKSISTQTYKILTEKFSAEATAEFLTVLNKDPKWTQNLGHLYLIRKLFGTLMSDDTEDQSLKSSIREIILQLIRQIVNTEVADLALLSMNIINTTLLKNSWAITQSHIDGIMTLVIVMSAPGSTIPPGSGRQIFKGLCMMLGSIVAAHRIRIGGRFHLMSSALQGLLRCLFAPYLNKAGESKDPLMKHPAWVDATAGPASAEQASEWARLVTSICDPPASAVKRSKNRRRQDVNDATKKARALAGRDLRNVLAAFCRFQLNGKLEPDARAAINPGLYAIFDVMGHKYRTVLNAALDSQTREVYKAAYEDWKNFGKWQGD